MLVFSARFRHRAHMDKKTFTIDPGFSEWLNENCNGASEAELVSMLVMGHLVDEGAPVPERYGVGKEDFLRAVDNALDDHSPLETYIEARRLRVEKEVRAAFGRMD